MQRRFSEIRRIFDRGAKPPKPVINEPDVSIPDVSIPDSPITIAADAAPVMEEKDENVPPVEDEVNAPAVPLANFNSSLPILSPVVGDLDLGAELKTLAVISLNLLADCNLTNSLKHEDDYRYKHAVAEAPWEVRLPKLFQVFTRHISQGKVDVFCLQEVDFYLFQADLKPFFAEHGFCAHHQWDDEVKKKKKESNHPFGVAICYREGKLKETFRESRSRTMMIGLSNRNTAAAAEPSSHKIASDWFVVNCHLEADSDKNEKRMAQLSSTLFNLSVHGKINPRIAKVIVMGDFNSLASDEPFQWLLGTRPATMESIQPHAFAFRDAYESADERTRTAATYADPHAAERVDQVAFTGDTCQVVQWLDVPALTAETREFGIFYGDYPSDHYLVGCLVRALPLPDNIGMDGDGEQAGQNKEEEENGSLTPGQMRVLEFLERGAPRRQQSKGKPSPAELLAIKSHAASMNAFTSHLNKSQKAWVAKWRKQYKHDAEEEEEKAKGFRAKATRSMSLYQKPQVVEDDSLAGLGQLFEEKPQLPAAATITVLETKKLAPKRRQTMFAAVKSAMF